MAYCVCVCICVRDKQSATLAPHLNSDSTSCTTLGTLLGHLWAGTCVSNRALGLGCLSCLLPLLLLLLGLGESLGLSSSSHLWLLVSSGSNSIKGGTNNGTLVLDGPARALLGSLLSDTLLVHSAAEEGPCDLSWVLSLQKEGLALG